MQAKAGQQQQHPPQLTPYHHYTQQPVNMLQPQHPQQPPPPQLGVQQTNHAAAAFNQHNAHYQVSRAALNFSPGLTTIDAQQSINQTGAITAVNTPAAMNITVIPTLSPRSESWHLEQSMDNRHPRSRMDAVPQEIHMWRTVAIAAPHPLHGDDLLDAQAAEWTVPSSSFEKLTERLMAFYSAHDIPKANYRYVGRLLRRHFGEIHIGQQPEAFVEQRLQYDLHERYLNADRCLRICAPPGCGGAYDKSASGFLQWWLIVLFIPTVCLLVGGIWLSYTVQQFSFTSSTVSMLPFLNTINTTDEKYTNWVGQSLLSETFVVEVPLVSNVEKMDQSLEYVPSVMSSVLASDSGPHDIALRLSWQVVDDTGVVVHTMYPTTLVPQEPPRTSICQYNSLSQSCVVAVANKDSDNDVEVLLSQWKKPPPDEPPIGCVVGKAEMCEPTRRVVSNSGTIAFEENTALSTKGILLPLKLRITLVEFRVAAKEAAKEQEMITSTEFTIEIQYSAQLRETMLSSFLIIVGCILLLTGMFFLFIVFLVVCCFCGYSEKVAIVDKDGNLKGYKNRRRLNSGSSSASRNDDICLQLYFLFYCCNVLPDLILCFSRVLDLCCGHCTDLCSTCGNFVSPLFSSCVFIECGEIGAACSELVDVCYCCADCKDCSCDLGAMDCAC